MFTAALVAATTIALLSLTGAFFFGQRLKQSVVARYITPSAVGVFLALVLIELVPKTLLAHQEWGALTIALGFIGFYILSYTLHYFYHDHDDPECNHKGAATLLLIGDAVHNFADGIIIGTAFLVNPTAGIAAAIGLALHEIPQEVVEFGVLIRAGYSRFGAALRNFISASAVILGTCLTLLIFTRFEEWLWIITGISAGNILYLAASELLPSVHSPTHTVRTFVTQATILTLGFSVMASILLFAHHTTNGQAGDPPLQNHHDPLPVHTAH